MCLKLASLLAGRSSLNKMNLPQDNLISGCHLQERLITILSLISLLISVYCWWNDVIKEGSKRGEHTLKVQSNLTIGFILFVISEAAIFFIFCCGSKSFFVGAQKSGVQCYTGYDNWCIP